MKAHEVIARQTRKRGITKAELSRRVGIDDELLRRSLAGTRKISADEFLALCRELGLEVADFFAMRDCE